ncbi:unnamed protein product [Adineta steineri]|uniref:Uncharacterized protein n=1 Tax=Adineta steineri TaxID=433720 RepID=A0A814R154_9BILA|nr:unnamed protein product [Adineta steineri]
MELQFYVLIVTVIIITVSTIIPTTYASNANVSIDYIKQGGCNSSILVRVDGENGVRAALTAGMKVVLVPSLPLSTYDTWIIKHVSRTLDSLLKFDPMEFGLPPFDDN